MEKFRVLRSTRPQDVVQGRDGAHALGDRGVQGQQALPVLLVRADNSDSNWASSAVKLATEALCLRLDCVRCAR